MGVPKLGEEGGGVCPLGNFSHLIPFFSEGVPHNHLFLGSHNLFLAASTARFHRCHCCCHLPKNSCSSSSSSSSSSPSSCSSSSWLSLWSSWWCQFCCTCLRLFCPTISCCWDVGPLQDFGPPIRTFGPSYKSRVALLASKSYSLIPRYSRAWSRRLLMLHLI